MFISRENEKRILNAFDMSYSNDFTEGINNLIKALKRVGFSYKDIKKKTSSYPHEKHRIKLLAMTHNRILSLQFFHQLLT